jgi:hypothetical protein
LVAIEAARAYIGTEEGLKEGAKEEVVVIEVESAGLVKVETELSGATTGVSSEQRSMNAPYFIVSVALPAVV